MELHLRGRPVGRYVSELRSLAAAAAPALAVMAHDPASPDAMVDLCRDYDVGLSAEQPSNINKDLCLGNKIFTYLVAGLPVVLTATTAQRELAADLGDAAIIYNPGDPAGLAAALRRWTHHRPSLAAAKGAAWAAARRRWHWEHPADRGALLELVAHVAERQKVGATAAT
jgi:glycosyltransferase involved in cell wall biosynthesis